VGKGKGGRMCRVEEKGEGVDGREEKALARSSEVLLREARRGKAQLWNLLSEIWCTSYWAAIYSLSPTDLQENLTLTLTLTLNPRHHSLYILLQLEYTLSRLRREDLR
jgi:hypothetical protein